MAKTSFDAVMSQGAGQNLKGLNPFATLGGGVQGSMFAAALGNMPGLIQGAVGSVNPAQVLAPQSTVLPFDPTPVGILGAKGQPEMAM